MRAARKPLAPKKGVGGKAAQALETALPDLLAFSPTSTIAIIFSLVRMSSSKVRARSDLD